MAIAQAQVISRELSCHYSAAEKTLMLTLLLTYARFTLKYSQHKHKKMEKIPFLVLNCLCLCLCLCQSVNQSLTATTGTGTKTSLENKPFGELLLPLILYF